MPKLYTIFDLSTGEVICGEEICPCNFLAVEFYLSISEQIALLAGDAVHSRLFDVVLLVP
jgi:hypothetical protein